MVFFQLYDFILGTCLLFVLSQFVPSLYRFNPKFLLWRPSSSLSSKLHTLTELVPVTIVSTIHLDRPEEYKIKNK